MKIQPLPINDAVIIQCLPDDGFIKTVEDSLDLVAACGEYLTPYLLLHEGVLPDAFFHLSSGFAGEILLKFTNYHLKVAAIISPDRIRKGKFEEFVLETNRRNDFRVFSDIQAASDWLIKK